MVSRYRFGGFAAPLSRDRALTVSSEIDYKMGRLGSGPNGTGRQKTASLNFEQRSYAGRQMSCRHGVRRPRATSERIVATSLRRASRAGLGGAALGRRGARADRGLPILAGGVGMMANH